MPFCLLRGIAPGLLCLALSACQADQQPPLAEYNDRIATELEMASRRMAAFYAGPELSTDQLDALDDYLQSAEASLLALPPYRDDASLRDEALNLLAFYRRLCQEQNRSLINLTDDAYYTMEDSLLVVRIVASILVEENRSNTRLREKQEAFARKHGLLLVTE
jgi:hypothetical protein